jgi:hypothetical protein
MAINRVYIDIGHGELKNGRNDPGAVKDSFVEHSMNIITGTALAERLIQRGFTVKLETGNLTIDASAKAANAFGANILISQHYNAGGGDRGEVIYSWKNGSAQLANAAAQGLKKAGQTVVNVYKSKPNSSGTAEYFGILRNAKMPAIIIEPCFIDNTIDRTLADTIEEQKNIGYCVGDAIASAYGSPDPIYIRALQKLVSRKIITSYDYWLNAGTFNHPTNGEWTSILINRIAQKDNINDSLKFLVQKGIISSPEYWQNNCKKGGLCAGEYVKLLIIRCDYFSTY